MTSLTERVRRLGSRLATVASIWSRVRRKTRFGDAALMSLGKYLRAACSKVGGAAGADVVGGVTCSAVHAWPIPEKAEIAQAKTAMMARDNGRPIRVVIPAKAGIQTTLDTRSGAV